MKYTYLILLLFLSGCVTNKADWGKYRGTSNTTSVLIDNKVISHEELDKNTKKEAKYVDLPVINYLHQVNTNKIERVTAIDTSSIIPLMIDEKIKVGPFLFQIVGLRRPEFGGDALELTLVPSQFTKENRDDILHINFFDPTGKRIRTKTKGSIGTKKFEKVIYSLNINPKKIVAEITYLKDKSVKMIHDLLPDPFLVEPPTKTIPRRTAQNKSFDWQGGVSDMPNAKYRGVDSLTTINSVEHYGSSNTTTYDPLTPHNLLPDPFLVNEVNALLVKMNEAGNVNFIKDFVLYQAWDYQHPNASPAFATKEEAQEYTDGNNISDGIPTGHKYVVREIEHRYEVRVGFSDYTYSNGTWKNVIFTSYTLNESEKFLNTYKTDRTDLVVFDLMNCSVVGVNTP